MKKLQDALSAKEHQFNEVKESSQRELAAVGLRLFDGCLSTTRSSPLSFATSQASEELRSVRESFSSLQKENESLRAAVEEAKERTKLLSLPAGLEAFVRPHPLYPFAHSRFHLWLRFRCRFERKRRRCFWRVCQRWTGGVVCEAQCFERASDGGATRKV